MRDYTGVKPLSSARRTLRQQTNQLYTDGIHFVSSYLLHVVSPRKAQRAPYSQLH